MAGKSAIRTIVCFLLICGLVTAGSAVSGRIWGVKAEKPVVSRQLVMTPDMTVAQFGRANALPDKMLKEIFGLKTDAGLDEKLSAFGSRERIASRVTGKLALAAEHAGKNWFKIPLKFALWFLFLSFVYFYLRKRRLTPDARIILLSLAVFLFGSIMGSDPNPMGTIKDAIHLYGKAHVIFPPRMIALAVFLAIVFIANKFICAWGCQAGTLQELLYRINVDENLETRLGRRIKLPFALTNTVRVLFFSVFVFFALITGTDIIAPIDPFKVYSPASLALTGGIFVGILLLLSLFIYRPWCHLFCPFGLAGWLVEKFSRIRVSVDYATCTACGKCAEACPSTVMGAILRRDKKTIPDCFSCYSCRDICPTGSVRYSSHPRTGPPEGHFP